MALTVVAGPQETLKISPGHSGGPITVEAPDSTSLTQGARFSILSIESNATDVIVTSNSLSTDDRIQDPQARSTAPTSTVTIADLSFKYIEWILIKTDTPAAKPLWFCTVYTI